MSFVRQRIPYKRRGKERGTRETEVPAYQDERERERVTSQFPAARAGCKDKDGSIG